VNSKHSAVLVTSSTTREYLSLVITLTFYPQLRLYISFSSCCLRQLSPRSDLPGHTPPFSSSGTGEAHQGVTVTTISHAGDHSGGVCEPGNPGHGRQLSSIILLKAQRGAPTFFWKKTLPLRSTQKRVLWLAFVLKRPRREKKKEKEMETGITDIPG